MDGVIDNLGTNIGYALSTGLWSILQSVMLSFKGVSWIGFAVARFFLGLTESGNFPACYKGYSRMVSQKRKSVSNRNI